MLAAAVRFFYRSPQLSSNLLLYIQIRIYGITSDFDFLHNNQITNEMIHLLKIHDKYLFSFAMLKSLTHFALSMYISIHFVRWSRFSFYVVDILFCISFKFVLFVFDLVTIKIFAYGRVKLKQTRTKTDMYHKI